MGLVLGFGTAAATQAQARSAGHSSGHSTGHSLGRSFGHSAARGMSYAHFYRGGGLQCVPFARENTGIELAGNAATWWSAAQGVYERGARPEVGSVLNFRANGRMRMGHVAVVSNVLDSRNIEIDHANWAGPGAGRGSVSRNITVVDVSPGNDWSAVRVALGHTDEFGSVYPTYGFIYDRPDKGVMVANVATAPAPVLNAAPRDLRPAAERTEMAAAQDTEEVAEAADDAQPRVRRVSSRHGGRTAVVLRTAHAVRMPGHHATVTRVDTHSVGAPRVAHHAGARHRA